MILLLPYHLDIQNASLVQRRRGMRREEREREVGVDEGKNIQIC